MLEQKQTRKMKSVPHLEQHPPHLESNSCLTKITVEFYAHFTVYWVVNSAVQTQTNAICTRY